MKTSLPVTCLFTCLLLFFSSCQTNHLEGLKVTNFIELEKRIMAKENKLDVMAEMKDEWIKIEFKVDEIKEVLNSFENWGGYLYSRDYLIDNRALKVYYPKLPKEALNIINKKMKSGGKLIVYGQVIDLEMISEMDSWILEIESSSDLLLQYNND